MAFEFDHLFICTNEGAEAAERLISLGFQEGSSNVHPGQGTANRRFFFHNAMLELLWVHDVAEAHSEAIRPTRLLERWENRDQGACPYGICLRSTDEPRQVAFSNWAFRPPYLPEALSIAVGTNSNILTEPMLFQTPFGKRPDHFSPEKAQPIEHTIGLQEITRVELISPQASSISSELQAVLSTKQIKLRTGKTYCLELGFDQEVKGQQRDCRPDLPLVLSW